MESAAGEESQLRSTLYVYWGSRKGHWDHPVHFVVAGASGQGDAPLRSPRRELREVAPMPSVSPSFFPLESVVVPFLLWGKRGGLFTPTLTEEGVIVERVTHVSWFDQSFPRLSADTPVSRNPSALGKPGWWVPLMARDLRAPPENRLDSAYQLQPIKSIWKENSNSLGKRAQTYTHYVDWWGKLSNKLGIHTNSQRKENKIF